MHSHCSSVCTRQCLFVKFVWAYGCISAANSSICSFLLPFANSSLRFSFSVVHVHGLKVFIIDHIQFHACIQMRSCKESVFILTYAFIFLNIHLFYFLHHSSCTRYIFFPTGSFSRAHNYWHIYWYNKNRVRYIDQTLFSALFLNCILGMRKYRVLNKIPNIEN